MASLAAPYVCLCRKDPLISRQAKTVVAPLDRVKILFQTSNPQYAKYSGSWLGFATATRGIYRQDGARGLFRGHSATLIRIFPYAGIKFLAYEQIRAALIPSRDHETHVRRFLSGSLAGVVSVFCTYPLEVIRVRLAFETKRDRLQRGNLGGICSKIYNERPRGAVPPRAAAGKGRPAWPAWATSTAASRRRCGACCPTPAPRSSCTTRRRTCCARAASRP